MGLTGAAVFLETLADHGITHAFVNLGSDHPALLEAFVQRRLDGNNSIEIITCPNEMVALSAAQGYAQVARRPAAVLVHVDCGTQALAGAVHNVSKSRVPVLIYAGASPSTVENELKGSRNEFIHWLQNVPDQPAIVRQYMKFVSQFHTAKNIPQSVSRALQIAKTEPTGPVYVWGVRETTEEDLDEKSPPRKLDLQRWKPIRSGALQDETTLEIADALLNAKTPLIVTSYLGRNPSAVAPLLELVELLSIPVFQNCPSNLNFPWNHWAHSGTNFNTPIKNPLLEEADVVLVLDSDIPWIPMITKPNKDALVIHIDIDPLKEGMAMFYLEAQIVCKTETVIALQQIISVIQSSKKNELLAKQQPLIEERRKALLNRKKIEDERLAAEVTTKSNDIGAMATVPQVVGSLKRLAPAKTLWLNEGISNYIPIWEHIAPTTPGSFFTSASSSLGWAPGAAIGAFLAGQVDGSLKQDLTAVIIGDGSFIFSVPSAVYWISRRYQTPFLSVVLNNGGWKSPKLSMLGVYPSGIGSNATPADLNISFGPDSPDYGGIAAAAGGAWTGKITKQSEIEPILLEAIATVVQKKRSAVVEVLLDSL